jgi:hypothetical protein
VGGFSFLKRWHNEGFYNVQEMEKVCWHMCDVAERLHNHGPQVMNIYDPDALKRLKASRNLTFEQRIVAICDMLKLSKFLCDNLMKGEGIEALVGAPKQKMSNAKTMVTQNKKRQKWLASGRDGDPERPKRGQDDGSSEPEDHDVPAPTQRKTKQKPMRTAPAAKSRAKKTARSRKVDREASDSEVEGPELSRRQSVFGNDDEDESEDKVMGERTISPTPSPSIPANHLSSLRIFRNTSLPSQTSTLSLASVPAVSPIPPASSKLTTTPPGLVRKTRVEGRIPSCRSTSAELQPEKDAEQAGENGKRCAELHTISKARIATAARARGEHRAKARTRIHALRKRTIDLTESDSEEEQSARLTKRSRKTSAAATRAASPPPSGDE